MADDGLQTKAIAAKKGAAAFAWPMAAKRGTKSNQATAYLDERLHLRFLRLFAAMNATCPILASIFRRPTWGRTS